jgi:hypothetical protein
MTSSRSTIADRVEQLQFALGDQLPDEVLGSFRTEQTGLYVAGVPEGAASTGDVLPDVQVLDVQGHLIPLTDVRDDRPAVVVLYRGAWCPYCNVALRAYQDDLVPELDSRRVQLIAISPQKADGSCRHRRRTC